MRDQNPHRPRNLPDDPAPYYEAHVFCCVNERPAGHKRGCCKSKGAEKLRNYMKARAKELGLDGIRINQSGCLDRCELGPTMVIYPEGIWYSVATVEDVEAVLQRHLVAGERVEHLMLRPGDKLPEDRQPTQAAPSHGAASHGAASQGAAQRAAAATAE